MFAVADLIVLDAIESGLENLRNNPHHLEFILGKYEDTEYMRKLHGSAYVRQCKDFVLKNKITVKPYYVLDAAKLPSVAVVAQYQEEIQVLGDYGFTQTGPQTVPPVVLGEVSGVAWGEKENELVIGNANSVTEWIYSGSYLVQKDWSSRISLVIPQENDTATVVCEDTIPKKTLVGWKVTTAPSSHTAILNASGNSVTVSIDLKSSGDIEVHKLLALVIRYCLRRGRLLMDENGLQNTISSQNFPIAHDEEQGIYQTVFTLNGKIWDCWIQEESEDSIPGLTMCAAPAKVTEVDQIAHFDF